MIDSNTSLKKTVLIVDDEPLWLSLMVRIVEDPSLRIERACDGAEALDKLKLGRIDLVISDTNMPKMNGIELLRLAQSMHPDLPVILLFSGLAGSSITGEEIVRMGASAILSKDAIYPKLKPLVAELLKGC